MLQLPAGEFWTTRRELRQRMFASDVIGGTMMFRRSLFAEGLRYPEANLAEDASFLREAMRRGRRLARLDNPGVLVYVCHGRMAGSSRWPLPRPAPGKSGSISDAGGAQSKSMHAR
jgi:hypothetical protein